VYSYPALFAARVTHIYLYHTIIHC